jgi:hypothetical protein
MALMLVESFAGAQYVGKRVGEGFDDFDSLFGCELFQVANVFQGSPGALLQARWCYTVVVVKQVVNVFRVVPRLVHQEAANPQFFQDYREAEGVV